MGLRGYTQLHTLHEAKLLDETASLFRTRELLTDAHLDDALRPVGHSLVPYRVPLAHVGLADSELEDILLTVYPVTTSVNATTRLEQIVNAILAEHQLFA